MEDNRGAMSADGDVRKEEVNRVVCPVEVFSERLGPDHCPGPAETLRPASPRLSGVAGYGSPAESS